MKRRLGIAATLACLALIAAMACYAFRAPILSSLARAWVVNDPIDKADAVVALGGGLQYRTFEAARLHQAGLAPKILIVQAKLLPTDKLGITRPERELFRAVLLTNEVPNHDIIAVGTNCTSTFDDVTAVRDWMQKNNAHTVLAPTDIFHTRRLRWIMNKVFRGSGMQFRIEAMTPKEYNVGDWWRHEEGLIAFQNEVVKYLYYRIKYR